MTIPEAPPVVVKEAIVFTLFGREYHIFGDSIISDVEANNVYVKLFNEKGSVSTTWRDDETHLL